jgi:hypothetical protein
MGDQAMSTDQAPRTTTRGSALASWLIAKHALDCAEHGGSDSEATLGRAVDVIRARNILTREREGSSQPASAAAIAAANRDENLLLEPDERHHL